MALTPEEERELEQLELMELEALDAASTTPTPAPQPAPVPDDRGGLEKTRDYVANLGRTVVGEGIPFYKQIISGARAAADPSTYGEGRDLGERYDLAMEQERGGLEKFRQENPLTAGGGRATGGFFSPINKFGPVSQGGAGLVNALKGTGSNIARNASEASLYGFAENGIEGAKDAATSAAIFTGGLDIGGRSVGGALDLWRLPEAMKTSKYNPTGQIENVPLEISNPKSVRAGLVRQGLGRVPGANERLAEASEPFVTRAQDTVDTATRGLDEQRVNLDAQQRQLENDVQYGQNQRVDVLDAQQGQQRLARSAAADADAARIANEGNTSAKEFAAATAQSERAIQEANEALNIRTLRESVPEGRSESITESGQEGYNQAKQQINEAYGEAWGTASDLKEGTVEATLDAANAALDLADEASVPLLKRLVKDIENLGESGSVERLDDILRRLKNSAESRGDTFSVEDFDRIRTTLRNGLPEDSAAKLAEVDSVYPAFLVTQKAAAQSAADRGVPDPETLLRSATNVAGERRAAGGEQPLLDTIYEGMDNAPQPPVKPPSQSRALPQATASEQVAQSEKTARKALARQAQAEARDLKNIKKEGDIAYTGRREETLGPLQEAKNKVAASAKLGSESLYMAALLAGALPGSGLAAKMTTGARIGRGLAGRKGQEFLGGQTEWQTKLANAIREGRTEYVTRTLSRLAAGEAVRDEEEEY